MKIVQAAVLVLVGALGAILFVKVKGGPEPSTAAAPAAIEVEAHPVVAQPVEPEEPTAPPIPDPPVRRREPKQAHARVLTSSVRRTEPLSRPADVRPVEIRPDPPQPSPVVNTPIATAPPPAPVVERAPEPIEPPAPPPPPRQATLKAGMLVPVRLIETVSSDKNHPGDTFSATLDAPLVVDGLVLAERGARVEGKVVESQQAGRVKGLASIALELTRLSLSDGQHVEISTDSFTKMGPESKGADAAKIGGGAALGAIIGAVAGGGKGAAIGAGVGGAAGTGTVMATRGKSATLPSETKISFRINNSVTVTERRKRS
jgi:hypothetical protein